MKTNEWLRILAMMVGTGFVLLFLFLVLRRLAYPFELTWIESYMYAPLRQRMLGLAIYQEPSFDYTSCNYPPLYFNLAGLLGGVFGLRPESVSFFPMRLVSAFASLGIFLAVLWVARSCRKAQWTVAIALASVYLAAFGRFEGWLDASRVDALMCFFFFLAATFMLEGKGAASAAMSGCFAGLAGLTKQPALVYIAGIGLFMAVVHRQWGRIALIGGIAAVVIFSYLSLSGDLFNRHFYYWLFEIPSHHPRHWRFVWKGLGFLAVTVPILVVVGLSPARAVLKNLRSLDAWRALPSWTAALAITTVFTLLLRTKVGASINFFMPVFVLAQVAFVEAAYRLLAKRPRLETALGLGLIAQLLMLSYSPTTFLPTAADAREAKRIVASLAAVDGPVWFGTFPSYAALAGKPWTLHDAGRLDLPPAFVASELSKAMENGSYGAFVLPANETLVENQVLRRNYQAIQLPVDPPPFLRSLHGVHFHGLIHVRRDLVPSFLQRAQPLFTDPVGLLL
jgi:hypothetical protein